MPRYQDLLPGVANVCLKVPTGGGKTFLAANAIEPIFHALGVIQQRVVVWLMPSDAILAQTLAALRNPAHPYRQKIDVAFNSRVEIYTKDQLLSATRFNISAITEQLSILVLSYDSFRGKKSSSRHGRRTAVWHSWRRLWALPPIRWRMPTPPPCCKSSTSFARW